MNLKRSLKLLALGIGLVLLLAAAAVAAGPKKAVFYDTAIGSGWFNGGEAMAKFFEEADYDVLDSADLAEFMTKRIADKAPSVIVFATDRVPNTVVPKAAKQCLMRQYLDAGGKIVWLGDIQLYYIQDPDKTDVITLGDNGSSLVLGVATTGKFDANEDVTITDEGAKWGLTETWGSMRAMKISKIAAATVTALANIEGGYSAAWVKNYGGPVGTGFVRLFDRSGSPSDFSWVQAVAEYGLK